MRGVESGSKVAMSNCRISHNVRYGIDVQGEGASAELEDVVTHHNGMTGLIVCNGAVCDLRGPRAHLTAMACIGFRTGLDAASCGGTGQCHSNPHAQGRLGERQRKQVSRPAIDEIMRSRAWRHLSVER